MDLAAQQRELARRAVGVDRNRHSPSELPLEQVEAFARSLVRKRAGEVRILLPRTAEALGSDFVKEFQRYAAGHSVEGAKRHAADAVAFARRLGEAAPAWIADLARYEAAWVELELGRKLLLRRFSHAVDSEQAASIATVWMIWVRLPWIGKVLSRRLWPPF